MLLSRPLASLLRLPVTLLRNNRHFNIIERDDHSAVSLVFAAFGSNYKILHDRIETILTVSKRKRSKQ